MRTPTNDSDWASDEERRIETSREDVYAKQKHKYTQKDHNLCYTDFDTISVRPFYFNSNLHAFMGRRKRAAAVSRYCSVTAETSNAVTWHSPFLQLRLAHQECESSVYDRHGCHRFQKERCSRRKTRVLSEKAPKNGRGIRSRGS